MSFHTPVKPLKPKEMKLEEGVVKGAVIVDEKIAEWNPAVGAMPTTSASPYLTINKNTEKLEDIVKRTADDLKLPDSESYALLFDDPRLFVSEETLPQLAHGFILTLTVAPKYYASKLTENLIRLNESLEPSLLRLSTLSIDPVFWKAFYDVSSIDQLYALIEAEAIKGNPRLLHLLLLSLSNCLDTNVSGTNWTTVPAPVIRSLAIHIIGQAKSEDSNTVLVVLQMMEKLVNCSSPDVRNLVFAEVPTRSLIRHLEKSDERVNKAALSLMNVFHSNADASMKNEIVDLLDSVPFRSAIRCSVLRDGRIRDNALLDQLVPLQRLLLNRNSEAVNLAVTEEQIRNLSTLPIVLECNMSSTELATALAGSRLGQFGVSTITRYLAEHAEDVRILVSENSMRVSGGGWELIPMALHCSTIMAELLGIVQTEAVCVEQLLEFLFQVDNPIDALFSVTVQLYHRTWREMQATSDESDKVGKVARQQIRKAIERFTATVAGLEEAVAAFPYWKMQEIWKRELTEKENTQLSSQTVSTLKTQLQPAMETLVRQNRKNFIKRGFTFKKVHLRGKTKDPFVFWKLDASEKYVVATDTDADHFVEGRSHSAKVKKILIKDISAVQLGDDGATLRKGGTLLRTLRLSLASHEVITVSSSSDHALCAWVDGLNELIGQKALSPEASENIDRLLNIELRLRLAAVPQPIEKIEIPPLPKTFSWVKPVPTE